MEAREGKSVGEAGVMLTGHLVLLPSMVSFSTSVLPEIQNDG